MIVLPIDSECRSVARDERASEACGRARFPEFDRVEPTGQHEGSSVSAGQAGGAGREDFAIVGDNGVAGAEPQTKRIVGEEFVPRYNSRRIADDIRNMGRVGIETWLTYN